MDATASMCRCRPVQTLEGHTWRVEALALTPDGTRLVSASADTTLRVWDIQSGRSLHTLEGHSAGVWSVAVTPDGTRALSASWDKTVRVWDLKTSRALRTLKGHTDAVHSVAATPYGTCAVSASGDGTLRLWDLESGRQLASFECNDRARSCAFSPDGRTLVAGDTAGLVYVLRLEDDLGLHGTRASPGR